MCHEAHRVLKSALYFVLVQFKSLRKMNVNGGPHYLVGDPVGCSQRCGQECPRGSKCRVENNVYYQDLNTKPHQLRGTLELSHRICENLRGHWSRLVPGPLSLGTSVLNPALIFAVRASEDCAARSRRRCHDFAC